MKIFVPQDLGQLIHDRRKYLGLSREKLSSLSDVGIRFIVDLEAGKPTIQFNKAINVANALDIEISATAKGQDLMIDYQEKFKQESKKLQEAIKKPNLMIIGNAGVGKSSLIAKAFRSDFVKVETEKGMYRHERAEIPIIIYETGGDEISVEDQVVNFQGNIISSQGESRQIHILWYCISTVNHRVTDSDIDSIKFLSHKFNQRLAIVLTQCDEDEATEDDTGKNAESIKQVITEEGIEVQFFETSIRGHTFQLGALLEWSCNILAKKGLQDAFITSQCYNLALKETHALRIVSRYALSAGKNGAIRIPFADASFLMESQMGMLIHVGRIFNISPEEAFQQLIIFHLTPLVGKNLAMSIGKVFPQVGAWITGSVASSVTYALGFCMIKLSKTALKEYLNNGQESNVIHIFERMNFLDLFNKELNNEEH